MLVDHREREYIEVVKPISFPQVITGIHGEITLEKFSEENQKDLWSFIKADRECFEHQEVWPGIDSYESLVSYMDSCDVNNPHSEEFGYVIRNANHQLAGTFHVFSIGWEGKCAEVGYWLHHQLA